MKTIHPLDGHTRKTRAGEMKRAWDVASSPLFAIVFRGVNGSKVEISGRPGVARCPERA